eukprot:TRINITY_DN49490_c0_g1_i1.p1 TRINITY_DN49490_c0_g1~~TRINITY_DN49490_c0_g1_i1.p1  ORF type:complete len:374 (-),score=115.71 TRINITY_DN49490_c0_g1_i1:9-1130(-)
MAADSAATAAPGSADGGYYVGRRWLLDSDDTNEFVWRPEQKGLLPRAGDVQNMLEDLDQRVSELTLTAPGPQAAEALLFAVAAACGTPAPFEETLAVAQKLAAGALERQLLAAGGLGSLSAAGASVAAEDGTTLVLRVAETEDRRFRHATAGGGEGAEERLDEAALGQLGAELAAVLKDRQEVSQELLAAPQSRNRLSSAMWRCQRRHRPAAEATVAGSHKTTKQKKTLGGKSTSELIESLTWRSQRVEISLSEEEWQDSIVELSQGVHRATCSRAAPAAASVSAASEGQDAASPFAADAETADVLQVPLGDFEGPLQNPLLTALVLGWTAVVLEAVMGAGGIGQRTVKVVELRGLRGCAVTFGWDALPCTVS